MTTKSPALLDVPALLTEEGVVARDRATFSGGIDPLLTVAHAAITRLLSDDAVDFLERHKQDDGE